MCNGSTDFSAYLALFYGVTFYVTPVARVLGGDLRKEAIE